MFVLIDKAYALSTMPLHKRRDGVLALVLDTADRIEELTDLDLRPGWNHELPTVTSVGIYRFQTVSLEYRSHPRKSVAGISAPISIKAGGSVIFCYIQIIPYGCYRPYTSSQYSLRLT